MYNIKFNKHVGWVGTTIFIFLISINSIFAQDCTELKSGDSLAFQLINQTIGTALINQACNITFLNYPTYTLALGNVSTTSQNYGVYNWTINTSLTAPNKYLATAYCLNNVISNYIFCIVGNYSREININTGQNITGLNINVRNNFTSLNNNITAANNTLATSINNLIIGLSNSLNTNFTALPTAKSIWEYSNRNMTWWNTTGIATDVWNSGTRTLTSIGTLIADIWAYATRTLSSYTGIWDYSPRNLTWWNTTTTTAINIAEIWEYSPRNLTWYNTSINTTIVNITDSYNYSYIYNNSEIYNNTYDNIYNYSDIYNTTLNYTYDIISNYTYNYSDIFNYTSGLTAIDVWEFANRNLTWWNNSLVASVNATEIWEYSPRNLTWWNNTINTTVNNYNNNNTNNINATFNVILPVSGISS
jgi:hypothetical protein